MLHLFQTPRTIAVLPSSSFDMARHSNRKGPVRLLLPVGKRDVRSTGKPRQSSSLVCPAKDFAHKVVHVRPDQRNDPQRSGQDSRRILERLHAASRPVLCAEPSRQRRTAAPLAGGSEVEAWTPRLRLTLVGRAVGGEALRFQQFLIAPTLGKVVPKALRSPGSLFGIDTYAAFHCVPLSASATVKTCPIEYLKCRKRESRRPPPIRQG